MSENVIKLSNTTKIILDTHVLVWYAEGIKIPKGIVEIIEKARNVANLFISQISIWEIAMLINKGRLSVSIPMQEWVAKLLSIEGLVLAELTANILMESCQLPDYLYKDPVDRMIIATARCNDAVLVTADQKILDYGASGHVKVAQI